MTEKNISEIIEGHDKVEIYTAIIDALSKQIPYKPKPYGLTSHKCKCGAVVEDKTTRHCGNCGQKLDSEVV